MPNAPEKFSDPPVELELGEERPSSPDDLGQLVDALPLAGFAVGEKRDLLFVNAAFCRLIGRPEKDLVGRPVTDIVRLKSSLSWDDLAAQVSVGRDTHEACEALRDGREPAAGEVFVRHLPGGRLFAVLYDASERRQAELAFLTSEEQRWQGQKTEALERLAGGIAHDFNNFLAVILLQTDMLNLKLADDSPLLHRVNEIKAVSNDAAGIVRQLLAFGRKQPMNPAPVVLNRAIGDSARVFTSLVGDSIRVDLRLAPDLGVCFVDQNQIAQALMFLAVNAKDAMPDGGKLIVETSNVLLERGDTHKAQSGGSYIQITVTDSGVGMDARTEAHIFEPFFSTKGSDKAAGLGLATVYGVVKQSGGFIWVTSEKGHGTSFKIQFPRIDQPEMASAATAPKPLNESGNETILVIEDEPAVRQVAAEILRRSGYKVLEASSGPEAVAIAQAFPDPIHLILTDFAMPKMNGTVAAHMVKAIYPEARVLYMSGNIKNIEADEEGSLGDADFLGKPFSSDILTAKVREVLDS